MSLRVNLKLLWDSTEQPFVDIDTDDEDVLFFIGGETKDGDLYYLTSEEARALAAALKHYADEVER